VWPAATSSTQPWAGLVVVASEVYGQPDFHVAPADGVRPFGGEELGVPYACVAVTEGVYDAELLRQNLPNLVSSPVPSELVPLKRRPNTPSGPVVTMSPQLAHHSASLSGPGDR